MDKEEYYQNIRLMVMEEKDYTVEDMEDGSIEDEVNREADYIYEKIFKEEH